MRAELVRLERAGYNPASDDITYPANIQSAQARVDARQGVAPTSFGGASEGASASGHANVSVLDRIVRPEAANPVDLDRP